MWMYGNIPCDTGFVSIEYEGSKLSEPDGIKATRKLLEKIRTAR